MPVVSTLFTLSPGVSTVALVMTIPQSTSLAWGTSDPNVLKVIQNVGLHGFTDPGLGRKCSLVKSCHSGFSPNIFLKACNLQGLLS